jgi:hypothetical protein
VLSPAFGGDKLALAAAGSGIAPGALLVVDGTTSFALAAKGSTKWLVKKTAAGLPTGMTIAQAIPAGRDVSLRVINADGTRSPEVLFRR